VKPVTVVVGSWHNIDALPYRFPRDAAIVRALWPGALRHRGRQAPSYSGNLGDARGTCLMLRMPLNRRQLNYLREGGPMQYQRKRLGRQVAVDARSSTGRSATGRCSISMTVLPPTGASTILDWTGPERASCDRTGSAEGIDAGTRFDDAQV